MVSARDRFESHCEMLRARDRLESQCDILQARDRVREVLRDVQRDWVVDRYG